MGLTSRGGLAAFCEDLASDRPSPGGGTASAAAGAMAASLVVMVLGLSQKSKKRAEHWEEMRGLAQRAKELKDELIVLSEEDAAAYDAVTEGARAAKAGGEGGMDAYEKALQRAAEVPLRTARSCAEVIELASRTGEIGIPSASSDVGVALHLAMAGFKGASMNVLINLDSSSDAAFVMRTLDALKVLGGKAEGDFVAALRGRAGAKAP